jgi:HEPN domain-containing protein
MSGLAKAMWRQVARKLEHARASLAGGHFEWAGFAVQRAAEKALKAVLLAGGDPAPHVRNLDTVFDALVAGGFATAEEKPALARALLGLTRTWAVARYPLPGLGTAPADLLTAQDAGEAIAQAEAVLAFARAKGVGAP